MKRFLACAMLLSLGLFTLGCGDKTPTTGKKTGTTPAATAPKGAPGPAAPTTPATPPAAPEKDKK